MPQDYFTLSRYIPKLNTLLKGAKINKINQPTSDDLFFTIYKQQVYKLHISTNATLCHISLSSVEYENPLVAPNFCMLLRKYLLGGEIANITLVNEDRIVKIDFSCENDFLGKTLNTLYLEIMGKYSNVFLVEDDKIVGAMKNIPLSIEGKRITLYGAKYTLPDKQDKLNPFDERQVEKAFIEYDKLPNKQDLANFIYRTFGGLSKPTSQEIAYRIQLLGGFELSQAVKTFINFTNEEDNATIISGEGVYDFYPFNYLHVSGNRTYFESLIEAQKEYYSTLSTKNDWQNLYNSLLGKVNAYEKKVNKKLNILLEKEQSTYGYEKFKLYGQLITDNVYQIKKGVKEITLTNYYSEPYSEIIIPLDTTLTAVQNAQKYFKKYTRLKRTKEHLIVQKEELLLDLNYVLGVKQNLLQSKTKAELLEIEEELIIEGIIILQKAPKKPTKNKVKTYNFREYEILGYKVLVGKNNIQNDALTFSADKNDLWLHCKDYHSSHVIIKSKNDIVPDKVIEISASICAYYSVAKSGDKIPVDYTLKKYVKKQPKTKLGSVIYTDYKTILVTPNAYEEYLKTK